MTDAKPRYVITAIDQRVRTQASTTTTDHERIKKIVVEAYRFAGYRVRVEEQGTAPDADEPELEIEGQGQ